MAIDESREIFWARPNQYSDPTGVKYGHGQLDAQGEAGADAGFVRARDAE